MLRLTPIIVVSTTLLVACGATAPTLLPPSTLTNGAAAVPTLTSSGSIDPCQLMTPQQASAIAGIALDLPTSHVQGLLRECVFIAGSASVFIQLQQSDDSEAVRRTFLSLEAQLSAEASFHVTDLPNLDDGAFLAQAKMNDLTAAGVYVLDGADFFDVVCESAPECSSDQLRQGATIVTSRLRG